MTVALFMMILVHQNPAGAADRDALSAFSTLYEENRLKFDGGTIRFDYIDGYAKTIDEARRGALTDSYKADGLYAYRGKEAMYRCLYPTEAMAAASSRGPDGRLINRFHSVRILTNGKLSLYDRIFADPEKRVSRGDIITSGTEDFYKLAEVPLDLGAPEAARDDLPRIARLVLGGGSNIALDEVDDKADFEGVKAVRLRFHGPLGKRTMWIDPERAAIPLRVRDEMPDGSTYTLDHGDIRLVPGRGWLPHERTVLVLGGRVKRIVITKADFSPVADDAFRLEFPEPTAMVNAAEGLSYRPQTSWDLSRLPSERSPGVARLASVTPAVDPVMPTEREPPSRPYFTVVALALSAAIGIIGFQRWRRDKRR